MLYNVHFGGVQDEPPFLGLPQLDEVALQLLVLVGGDAGRQADRPHLDVVVAQRQHRGKVIWNTDVEVILEKPG